MRNRMYGGVRGRKAKVGRKLLRFPPTRFLIAMRIFSHYDENDLLSEYTVTSFGEF